jgi:hypothetical protein
MPARDPAFIPDPNTPQTAAEVLNHGINLFMTSIEAGLAEGRTEKQVVDDFTGETVAMGVPVEAVVRYLATAVLRLSKILRSQEEQCTDVGQ